MSKSLGADLRELAAAPITRIRVNTHSDSYFFSEFDDSDLIELWKNYLLTVELKKVKEPIFKNSFKRRNKILGGWGRSVIFTTENGGEPFYLIIYRDGTVRFDKKHKYTAISSGECPLDITCRESIKRHGEFEEQPCIINKTIVFLSDLNNDLSNRRYL